MINGIIHRLSTSCQWRGLPERFGPWQTVSSAPSPPPHSSSGSARDQSYESAAAPYPLTGAEMVRRKRVVPRLVISFSSCS
ncbi:transposase [Actinoallomurus sp. NPDC052308]|uniref:transposase n=1 Tax=Actinoallomurus sp. NPDC052308 TaxID=3155530 RepID=UPI00344356CA